MADSFGLLNQCHFRGQVPQDKIQKQLSSFDLLLATSLKCAQYPDYCIPSKIFEYIAAQRPTLAVVCPAQLRDFVTNSHCGIILDPDNVELSSSALIRLLMDGACFELNEQYLRRFHRRNLTEEFANVIKQHANAYMSDAAPASSTK